MRARCWLDAVRIIIQNLRRRAPKQSSERVSYEGRFVAALALNNYLMQLDLSHLTIKRRPFIMQTMRLFIYPTHTYTPRGVAGEKVAGVG
jgi:hypothetical protein